MITSSVMGAWAGPTIFGSSATDVAHSAPVVTQTNSRQYIASFFIYMICMIPVQLVTAK
jgi:hypothetical protein